MKKIVLVSLFCILNLCFLFAENDKRVVEWNDECWDLGSNISDFKKVVDIGSKKACGEGIDFVYDNSTKKKYLIDRNGKILSEKQFKHVGYFSDGKTVVSGYLEEKYESDRIYDVVTDEVSEPIPNMWIYCGFIDGLAAFSYKNESGQLKCILTDINLSNFLGIEFDQFYEHNEDGTWRFEKDNVEYLIDKNGKLISK